jgi:hypothetical protein
MAAHVEIHHEVPDPSKQGKNWELYFQKVAYHYDDGSDEKGYRFIYRRPDGKLQAARGQARIPDRAKLRSLIGAAGARGWLK